jgi:hypothetical protein
MTIDPKLSKSHHKSGDGGALMLNIRVRHIRKKGTPPPRGGAILDALQALLDRGQMPEGWQFMFVDWKNPKKYGSDWQSGWPSRNSSDDPEEFNQAFAAVVQSQIRMARVRKV